MSTTHAGATSLGRDDARIGPIGMIARVVVGSALIVLAVTWNHATLLDAVAGLVVAPAVVIALAALRARHRPRPLRATGPLGHAVNVAVFVPLFLVDVTSEPAFLFYGASMLVAAVRRSGGCEVTAISNAVLGRDDQVGCVPFTCVDLPEAQRARAR